MMPGLVCQKYSVPRTPATYTETLSNGGGCGVAADVTIFTVKPGSSMLKPAAAVFTYILNALAELEIPFTSNVPSAGYRNLKP